MTMLLEKEKKTKWKVLTGEEIKRILTEAKKRKSEEILGKGGRKFLEELKKDPQKALAFFRCAGIIDKNGKLTKNYR